MGDYYADNIAKGDEAMAEESPTLGPNYYHAAAISQKVMANFAEEHLQPLGKLVGDFLADKVWDMLRDSIISDTEYNIAGEIYRRIDNAVLALLSAKPWALRQYVFEDVGKTYGEGLEIRKQIAALIPDEIQDARIQDLEAQVAALRKDNEWLKR